MKVRRGGAIMAQQYDTIILGAGPGGMTAATYASRANMSVLMIDRGIYGGQMNNTAEIENYPGFPSILGPELAEKMYASSTQFGAEYAFGTYQRHTQHQIALMMRTSSPPTQVPKLKENLGSFRFPPCCSFDHRKYHGQSSILTCSHVKRTSQPSCRQVLRLK